MVLLYTLVELHAQDDLIEYNNHVAALILCAPGARFSKLPKLNLGLRISYENLRKTYENSQFSKVLRKNLGKVKKKLRTARKLT